MRMSRHWFVMLLICSLIPSSLASQGTVQPGITLQLKDVPLSTAIAEIAALSSFPILFSSDMLPQNWRVSVDARNSPPTDVLDRILARTGRRAQVGPYNEILIVNAPPEANGVPHVEERQASITGRVFDVASGRPVVGAVVAIEASGLSAVSDSTGRYTLSNVPAGQNLVTVQHVGFSTISRSVSVSADDAITLDFPVSVAVIPLEQLIVSGTVVETAKREIPNPITVITATEIQRAGVRNVADLLRGQVPGVISPDNGPGAEDFGAGRGIYIRGGTSLSGAGPSVKAYIDGVEVANPRLIHTIDPSTIERIEILRGPQASTIYGSGSLSGVIQIFLKRGFEGQAPIGTVDVSAGRIESSHSNSGAPQADVMLNLAGSDGRFTYSMGGTFRYEGAWRPDWFLDSRNAFGRLGFRQGKVSVDLSARFSNRESRMGRNPIHFERIRRGEYTFSPAGVAPFNNENENQAITLGGIVRYQARDNWRHEFTIGQDQANFDGGRAEPTFYSIADTLTNRFRILDQRISLAYNTSLTVDLTDRLKGTFTAGADQWRRDRTTHSTGQTELQSRDERNRGVFSQAHVGLDEKLYITVGARAEDNPEFGDEAGWVFAPRAGLAYVHEFGNNTIKIRASGGAATRPPAPGNKEHLLITPTQVRLANPDLLPENQSGIDSGIEVYLGSRASLEITHYNQTVNDLIYEVFLFENIAEPNEDGFVRVRQFQNLGQVHNKGWELQGRVDIRGLDLRGTYTVMDSRIKSVREGFRGTEEPGDRLPGIARSAASISGSYAIRRASAAVAVNYVGRSRLIDNLAYETERLNRLRTTGPPSPADFMTDDFPGVTRVNVSATVLAIRDSQVYVRVDNILDSYGNDVNSNIPSRGRLSTLGVRWQF